MGTYDHQPQTFANTNIGKGLWLVRNITDWQSNAHEVIVNIDWARAGVYVKFGVRQHGDIYKQIKSNNFLKPVVRPAKSPLGRKGPSVAA